MKIPEHSEDSRTYAISHVIGTSNQNRKKAYAHISSSRHISKREIQLHTANKKAACFKQRRKNNQKSQKRFHLSKGSLEA